MKSAPIKAGGNIQPEIVAGKGGVGKSFTSCSIAAHKAHKGELTLVIDTDGGHSVLRTLGVKACTKPNLINRISDNLCVAVIEPVEYLSIGKTQKMNWPFKRYFAQFPYDYGIVAFTDMVHNFFGVPTDPITVQKFTSLVRVLLIARNNGFKHIIIDVEPTAGLERLLSGSADTVRSLRNLSGNGKARLLTMAAGWKDVSKFLATEYMQRADSYCSDIEYAAKFLTSANYLLVSTPEESPADQTFVVRSIIEKFGGKVRGCVVNNIRDEDHESAAIEVLQGHNLPMAMVRHNAELHQARNKLGILREIGESISDAFLKKPVLS
jgi:anion-transporting  ArsA/GET3 family ATPase